MLTTALSMLLTLGWMWHGRDKVWTPTFKGTRVERYTQGVNHYRGKMGLQGDVTFTIVPKHDHFCAWVGLGTQEWGAYDYGFVDPPSKDCKTKPEMIAFHEACHERWAHVGRFSEELHKEVKQCMVDYSRKDRR